MSIEVSLIAIAAAVSATAGAIAGFIKNLIEAQTRKDKERSFLDATKRVTEIGISIAGVSLNHTVEHDDSRGRLAQELLREIETEIASQAAISHSRSNENLRSEVDSKLGEVRSRLEAIEERFPDKSSIDKIASINDALFAERIDQLSSKIEAIEKKQLTRWDIAITVCAIISGIFAIVGTTYAVLRAFGLLSGAAA